MIVHTDLAVLSLNLQQAQAAESDRLLQLRRAAEARHRVLLLNEARALHGCIADVWDPSFHELLMDFRGGLPRGLPVLGEETPDAASTRYAPVTIDGGAA